MLLLSEMILGCVSLYFAKGSRHLISKYSCLQPVGIYGTIGFVCVALAFWIFALRRVSYNVGMGIAVHPLYLLGSVIGLAGIVCLLPFLTKLLKRHTCE